MGAQDTLIKHLEDQGATVKKIKKGIMIYGPPPTLGTFTIHNTPSDHRALANDMAALRRIGLTHPLDNKPLTMEVAEGYGPHVLIPISPRIDKRARQVLHSLGWPLEATTTMLTGYMAGMTAEKALYQLGYRHHPEDKKGRNQARIWVGGAEVARLHEEVEKNRVEPDVEVKLRESEPERFDSGPVPELGLVAECLHYAWENLPGNDRKCADCGQLIGPILTPRIGDLAFEPGPDPGLEFPAVPEVEFIDERDSWVVDPEQLLGTHLNRMVKDRLAVLGAVGIDYEIRVWRKKEA